MDKDTELGEQEPLSDQPSPVLDWDGATDKDNPHNWALWKRCYHTVIPSSFSFLCTFGSSVYTPGDMAVMAEFGVSREMAILPFVIYLLGLAFGPVLAAPLSETYGRRIVYLTSVPISGLFTIGAGFSQNIAALTICRFFAAFFCSPGLSIGTGTASDVWKPEERGVPMACFVTTVQLGPAFGPLLGGFVVQYKSWRWTQWIMLFALGATVTMTLGMSETYKKVILQRRAKRLGLQQPQQLQKSTRETIRFFMMKTLIRPLHMLCTETIVSLFDLYVAFAFGLLNAFFTSFAWVFRTVYGMDTAQTGLTFLSQAAGTLVGCAMMIAFDHFFYKRRAAAWRDCGKALKLPPEQRLWIAMAGAPMLPISLFWFGWTARSDIHWISPTAAEAVFSCGNLLIFTCAGLYLTDCYGALYGASAWASNTLSRYLFAVIFPLFATQMYEAMGPGWATSLLGFCTIALAPIPFVFYKYGERLRRNSKYAPEE